MMHILPTRDLSVSSSFISQTIFRWKKNSAKTFQTSDIACERLVGGIFCNLTRLLVVSIKWGKMVLKTLVWSISLAEVFILGIRHRMQVERYGLKWKTGALHLFLHAVSWLMAFKVFCVLFFIFPVSYADDLCVLQVAPKSERAR